MVCIKAHYYLEKDLEDSQMGVSPSSSRITVDVITSAGCKAVVKSWVRATSKKLRERQLLPADSIRGISESTKDINFTRCLPAFSWSCLLHAWSLIAVLSTLEVTCVLRKVKTHAMLQRSQNQQKHRLLNPQLPPYKEDYGKGF